MVGAVSSSRGATAAAGCVAGTGTTVFKATGAEQCYTVPSGVTSVHVVAIGARPFLGRTTDPRSGFAATVTSYVAVSPGQTLYVEVDVDHECFGEGGPGNEGGDGGGASDVRTCSLPSCRLTGRPSFSSDRAPSVSIAQPDAGSDYRQESRVSANYACRDPDGSFDLLACTGTVADGARIDTTTPGTHTLRVSARDKGGQRSSETVTYVVDEIAVPPRPRGFRPLPLPPIPQDAVPAPSNEPLAAGAPSGPLAAVPPPSTLGSPLEPRARGVPVPPQPAPGPDRPPPTSRPLAAVAGLQAGPGPARPGLRDHGGGVHAAELRGRRWLRARGDGGSARRRPDARDGRSRRRRACRIEAAQALRRRV